MQDLEAIQMMRRASSEIKDLRRHIDRLRPKADAYDNLTKVLGLLPSRGEAMGEDVAWLLDRRISEIEAALKKAEADPAATA